ncbi:hypothetical protein CONPUDRAFT_139185 [Coniophora puteana RWD-64-598 SS2]|uniref:Uncharacterized protein n=1 Tax=Coniophora puteana (strain RWD-64-598) TaxID=741705 RepID=A0A5M3MD47_CONPW|nr:uncharacterized protein CONPUDRAFT_139185 [Coniophora puteana RWD-64-598 SS2]EIW77159.1 hypothetical protein CONPUDRAFT_139185 [Coniophora puteana RWD-64-598 SS2]
MANITKPDAVSPEKCSLVELTQYSCEPEELPNGQIRPRCFPIPRIFRMCANRPAVEITRLVEINPNTGEVTIPGESSLNAPKGKLWKNVTTLSSE